MSKIIKFACVEDTPRVIERPVLEITKGQMPEALPLENKAETEAQHQAQLIVQKAETEATSLMEETRQQAAAVLNQAKKEAEQLKTLGHDEGYQAGILEGKREGQKQGLEIGKQEYHDKIETANQLIINAQQEAKDFITSSERQIIAIALSLAQKVLMREIEENPMVVLPIVRQALEKIRDQESITIRVSPEDYELVQKAKVSLQTSAGCEQCLTVLADETIAAGGGCMIDTANGTIDAKLETQFEILKKALQNKLP